MLQVEPDVERSLRRDFHLQTELFKTLEDMVTLVLEVSLQGDFLFLNVHGMEKGDSSQLQSVVTSDTPHGMVESQ